MKELDKKINQHFSGLVVRKDLVKTVKGNAIVPAYVLEYLLGQYCATTDEESIQSGIETVKDILREHYVHRSEAGKVKSDIKEKGRLKIIDKVSVALNEKTGSYEAEFENLNAKKILIDSDTVKKNKKMLVSGIWCIADLEWDHKDDGRQSPFILESLKAIQLSHFDFNSFVELRKQFSTEEWIDLMIQSIGFNPEHFSSRNKLLQLARLIPFCERNYNLIELGPKGTGKSHIFSEFSPHGILISGGEVSVPKLFVNNSNGKIGLVGYWDVVAFDEFAGRQKRVDKALVDIMKNYMAQKTFSRGVGQIGAEASLVFVGNTQHTLPYMLKHTDLFDELPEKYRDSAFLDRLHFYIPGWEVDILRGEMFSDGYGFVVDYLAEVLRHMRNFDFSQKYKEYYELDSDISTRDRDAVEKTFSGLMKVLFPHGEITPEEMEKILSFSMESRKRIKDQILRLDTTYTKVQFQYKNLSSGKVVAVKTLEEKQYPSLYSHAEEEKDAEFVPETVEESSVSLDEPERSEEFATEKHLSFDEDIKGLSYEMLFEPYIANAKKITITDSYIRAFHQIRNLMEFLELVVKTKCDGEEVEVHLVTVADSYKFNEQREALHKIQQNMSLAGIRFTFEFDKGQIHARHIVTDTNWKISLDRGLDIFQHYEMNDAFALSNRNQTHRACKAFEVTYIKLK